MGQISLQINNPYDLLANRSRRDNLSRIRPLLHVLPRAVDPVADASTCAARPSFVCRYCGSLMVVTTSFNAALRFEPHPRRTVTRESHRAAVHQFTVGSSATRAVRGPLRPTS
jgi:hypothetical protein